MRVRATRDGFYGGALRTEGAEFDVVGDVPASWYEPIDVAPAEEAPAQPKSKGKPKAEPKPGPEDPADFV